MLNRYREHAEALFGNEDALYALVTKYKAKYVLMDAGMLLRDDKDLSFRYVAAAGDIKSDWVIYKMHFFPETLTRFDLVYQNDFVRTYEVGKPFSNRVIRFKPLFSMEAFNDFTKGNLSAAPDFLKHYLKAYNLLRQGLLMAAKEGPEGAIQYFQGYSQSYPKVPEGWIFWGIALRAEGKMKESPEIVKRAMDLDQNNATLLLDIAVLQSHLGDNDGAIESLKRAHQIDAKMRHPLLGLAIIYMEKGDLSMAESYLNEVLKTRPDDSDALSVLKRMSDQEAGTLK